MEEKKDLLYLMSKIEQSEDFWRVNYYLRSMKKAPHGGVMRIYQPNSYVNHYPFAPWSFVCYTRDHIPFFMQKAVEYALDMFDACDNLDYEEMLQYCFSGDNWYAGFVLLHVRPEFENLNREMHDTLLWGVLENHKRIIDFFEIEPQYAIYALLLCMVEDKAINIKDTKEIQVHEKLKEPLNKYGLTKLDSVEFLRQGFIIDDTYYLYNIFIDPTIASPLDTMPYTFRILTEEILDGDIYMRCDENLAVPKTKLLSTATVDFQKFHGITVDFANIEMLLGKEIIVHIHPTLGHKILMIIKPDTENRERFFHIEVEQLWEPSIIKDTTVFATFIHAKFFPQKRAFTHIDFSINQYNTDVYAAKHREASNETGIPVDKYGDIHYKVWCVEANSIEIETWSKLICATLDEPFREIFLEMFNTPE